VPCFGAELRRTHAVDEYVDAGWSQFVIACIDVSGVVRNDCAVIPGCFEALGFGATAGDPNDLAVLVVVEPADRKPNSARRGGD
jgi:hypothetical protein